MIFDRREVGVTRLDILIVWQQQFDAFYEPRPKVRNTALSLSLSLFIGNSLVSGRVRTARGRRLAVICRV